MSAHPDSKALGEEEFLVCSFLVGAALQGVPLPEKLPKELLKSIKKPSKESSSGNDDDKHSAESMHATTSPATAGSPTVAKVRSSRLGSESSPDQQRRKSQTLRASGSVAAAESPVSGTSLGSGKRPKSKWALSKEEKKRYMETFAMHNAEGFVDGGKAVQLFTMSGLPQKDLAYIWALSDMDRDRQLSQQEFLMAMHLITRRMKGDELPPTIPTALVLSASSDTMSSKKTKGLNRAGQSSGVTRTASSAAAPTSAGPPSTTSPSANATLGGPVRSVSMYNASSEPNSARPSSGHLESNPSLAAASLALPSSVSAAAMVRPTAVVRSSSGVGFGSAGSYSASDLPTMDSLLHGSNRIQSTNTLRSPTLMPIAAYGVEEKITPEYDASSDLMKLEQITDLSTVKMILAQLTDEVKTLSATNDRLQLQQESLKDKLATRLEQNSMAQRRRSNFETILRNYNQQLEADTGLYESLKAELNDISAEIELQQQQLNAPQADIHQLREKRRALMAEYARVKAESNASHDEHTRLVLEVEKLRLEGAEQAARIDTNWQDHGFKEEPAVAFGDSDYSTGSLSRTTSTAAFTPSFNFKHAHFGTGSGTMTPTIDEFDFNDGASEAGEDPDLAWLKTDAKLSPNSTSAGSAASALLSNNSDFFATESANWADFSVQEDERRRERVVSSVSKEKRPGSKKMKTDSPKSPSEKKKKKSQH